MTKKIIQNVKTYHFVYVILIILLIAGASTGIYFYIKNKLSGHNHAPTSECGTGKIECLKDGSIVCCDTQCCGGVCLKTGFTCIDGIQCEDKMVCTNKSGKQTCCSNEQPNCNETLGICNACTIENPPCEGNTVENKGPICCGLNGNDCYSKEEKTTDLKLNPCVCSGGVDGIGGKCCSKNRSLCPGESYGQKNIGENRQTRNKPNECLLGPENTKCICITALDKVAVEDIAVDDTGKQCHKNLIYKSGDKYLCCGTDNSEGEPSIYVEDKQLKCCAGNKVVGGKSVCYSKNTFKEMDSNSPLEGKCSGASSDDSKNSKVCVNPKNFESSSLTTPPCTLPEILVDLPYYELINQPGKITYQNDEKNYTVSCPSASLDNSDRDCHNLPQFSPETCTEDSQCNNRSKACVDRDGNPVKHGSCNPLANPPTYNSGICGVGCPTHNPTTICGDSEICYTYEANNKDGSYESGFCGLPPQGVKNPTSDTTPDHLTTQKNDGTILYYDTKENCDKYCGARFGYCDQVMTSDNKKLYTCKLPVCAGSGNKNYIYNDTTVGNLNGSNTITYKSGGTMAQCMLDQNKQYIDRITFDAEGACTGDFDCTKMLTAPSDELTPTYSNNPILPNEKLYTSDGNPSNVTIGPFTYKGLQYGCQFPPPGGGPNGIFCNTNNTSCCDSSPAGIY